jgi:hypothetical protein
MATWADATSASDSIHRVGATGLLFCTTNLAKRMPDAYFQMLASSGMHHVNISNKPLDLAIYETVPRPVQPLPFQPVVCILRF